PYSLFFFYTLPLPPISTLFPYTTLFRSLNQRFACWELPRQAGEIFPKLPGYETKHSTSSNHICAHLLCARPKPAGGQPRTRRQLDRKSTRLNSSHQIISYAVFCLKKKTK